MWWEIVDLWRPVAQSPAPQGCHSPSAKILEHHQPLRVAHRLQNVDELQIWRHGRFDRITVVRGIHRYPPTR